MATGQSTHGAGRELYIWGDFGGGTSIVTRFAHVFPYEIVFGRELCNSERVCHGSLSENREELLVYKLDVFGEGH